MGTSLIAKNAKYTANKVITSMLIDDTSGLISEYLYGIDFESTKNDLVSSTELTEVGSPSYANNYVSLATTGYGANTLTFPMAQPTDVTMIVICRAITNFPGMLISQVSNKYFGFNNYNNQVGFYNSTSGTSVQQGGFARPAAGEFFFLAGTGSVGGLGKNYVIEDNVVTQGESILLGGVREVGAVTMEVVGNTITSSGSGEIDIAYSAIFDRVLTEEELLQVYTSLKTGLLTLRNLEIR